MSLAKDRVEKEMVNAVVGLNIVANLIIVYNILYFFENLLLVVSIVSHILQLTEELRFVMSELAISQVLDFAD
jgi:hypothetical protein